MALAVNRIDIRLNPDYKKVIPRFFDTGIARSHMIIEKVHQLPESIADELLQQVLSDFSVRYRDIHAVFLKHFEQVRPLVALNKEIVLSENKQLLLGAYFTMEYSIEAAALFNPSIVEDPDQQGAGSGEKKVVISFRATGESHISSVVFRRGLLDAQAMIHFEPAGKFLTGGTVKAEKNDEKAEFSKIIAQMNLPEPFQNDILARLPDSFSYKEVQEVLKEELLQIDSVTERKRIRYDILSVVNTSYELHFPEDSMIAERVIFPVTKTEKNGIEDARFVKFTEDDGTFKYVATYTAYDGSFILPQLIITTDFLHFKVVMLHGKSAINKNLALFPRKIHGQYAMISRIDGMNNYIMFSDDMTVWEEATLLQQPKYPWEFIQIGNAGSPIETEQGWLVITHGVGPMRKYCLGASLFDLDDPRIELGRMKDPLLVPNEDERHGYVPNVVYSCGSMLHGDVLFIPYAVSDHASSFATVPLNDLLAEILKDHG